MQEHFAMVAGLISIVLGLATIAISSGAIWEMWRWLRKHKKT